jgi:hypothetical protein
MRHSQYSHLNLSPSVNTKFSPHKMQLQSLVPEGISLLHVNKLYREHAPPLKNYPEHVQVDNLKLTSLPLRAGI